jgi:hypothetical protein
MEVARVDAVGDQCAEAGFDTVGTAVPNLVEAGLAALTR